MQDEPLKLGVIGEREKSPIRIDEYDSNWPKKFETHAGIIAGALGDAALRIEHIGSTSVPGLGAKPIVDILVVVPDSTNESTYLPQLEAAGYVLRVREPDWNEHRMFRTSEKDVHLHVYSTGCPEIQRNLIFRDRLRRNIDDRLRYEETKRQLAAKNLPDHQAYTDGKTEVIESIIAAAQREIDQ
jgi:GrpB-like predicted nucleotidyltransferase (UPF0157 family)